MRIFSFGASDVTRSAPHPANRNKLDRLSSTIGQYLQ